MFTDLSYFAAQVVTIAALALMGLSFLLSNPRNINARLFALICLSTITYIISTMQYQSNPEFRIDLSAYWLPLQIMMNVSAGCLMILCYSLFQDMNKFPRWMLGIFGIQLVLSTLRPLFVTNNYSEIDIESIGRLNYFVFGSLPLLLQVLFAIIGGYWIVKGWRADVIESRRLLRLMFSGGLVILFVSAIISELFIMDTNAERRIIVTQFRNYGSTVIIFLLALACLKFESFTEKAAQKISGKQEPELDVEVELQLDNFNRIFRDQKSYLEPGLSIADLAKKLAMPQYRLRHLVNKKLGYRNFNALLNEYRIGDACAMLSDLDKNQTPVLTIALTVGYQSIAPFNQAFRELKGITPTEFRKQSQRDNYLAEQETSVATPG